MIRKWNILIFLSAMSFLAIPLLSEDPLCDQIANYTMDVKLDTEQKAITAKEIISWTNSTEHAADELWFHLYWNAFQNSRTDFLVEGTDRWGPNFYKNNRDDWGYIRIDSIRLVDVENTEEYDLTPTVQFRQPDDDNTFDQTVMSVGLPQPVSAGDTIILHIDFHSKIPKPIHRTGVYRDSFFIAQWFPKIGVFSAGRWNCHQFHATTNFFADYGTYDIRITLPSHYKIGATGEHRDQQTNSDGTTTHRFVQHSVHDFAWTASPHYLEFRESFQFSPGKSTEITLLLQPYHKNQKDRYMNATKNALKHCSLWYGDYPYTTVTCVDPAYNSRSGGMEYPTLFTGGTYFLTRKGIPQPEGVTIHEFGHGYFYGLVGTNEFEDAWMDEGFTSFLDSEVYHAAYGNPFMYRFYFGIPAIFKEARTPIELKGISSHRRTYDMDIMQNYTWNFLSSNSYFANSYSKAELMLRTLQRYLGRETFNKMIKAYSTENWFKHPKPEDFYAIVSLYAGQDMSWFLDQFVHGSGKLDYAVGKIISQRKKRPTGWLSDKYIEKAGPKEQDTEYRSEVCVRRLGEVKIPVEVLVVFEDGSEILETWDGQYRWKRFVYQGPSKLEKAVIDPEFKLVIDVNRTNNSQTLNPNAAAPLKWTYKWMLWIQHGLEVLSLLGS
ncbi:MAG: M1 family metallopeptidase [Candidatus Aminicenantes bacterium]|nr:M1 family metallopeptidase [Candidatus Aminicenantes bacterium]